jgi:hypothetical protein
LNLNLRNVVEISILGEDHESVSNRGRCDPRVHRAGTAAHGSSVRNDRGESTCDFSIDRDRIELALNPAERAKPSRPGVTVFGT